MWLWLRVPAETKPDKTNVSSCQGKTARQHICQQHAEEVFADGASPKTVVGSLFFSHSWNRTEEPLKLL